MEIYINNQLAVLKQGTSFDYISENRLFSGSDDYTLTITFPLAGCAQNLAIFGNIDRADVEATKLRFDCEILDRNFYKFGTITITEISETEVKTQFLEGRSEQNFDDTFDDIYINELDLGSWPYPTKNSLLPIMAWSVSDIGVALPWVNDLTGNIQNMVTYEDGVYNWDENTKGISWQPYLLYITRQICEAVGYSHNFAKWERNSSHKYLLICNTLPYAWGIYEFARALPHWTVTKYFEKLELLLGCEFDIDHRSKKISFAYSRTVLAGIKPIEITNIIDEHSIEVTADEKESNCDYIEAKNLVYKECSHNMWKFYSCDWFIKSWSKSNVESYATLSKLVMAAKKYASWDGRGLRGSILNKLLYAKDENKYFVIRAVWKTLVRENEDIPNIYQYTCVLQPVNSFGGRIIDDDDDADETEIEFVPACIDFTEEAYGRCLFLSCSGYDESDGTETSISSSHKDEVDETLYQPHTVQALEAGEADSVSEYYDKIYIGFWDGEPIASEGKLPYPIIDEIEITDDWQAVQTHVSLSINKLLTGGRISDYNIDPRKKYTFKFLSDEMPNVRALMFIHGKRYIAEKITATFTESGMSQLLKLEAYPVI